MDSLGSSINWPLLLFSKLLLGKTTPLYRYIKINREKPSYLFLNVLRCHFNESAFLLVLEIKHSLWGKSKYYPTRQNEQPEADREKPHWVTQPVCSWIPYPKANISAVRNRATFLTHSWAQMEPRSLWAHHQSQRWFHAPTVSLHTDWMGRSL